MTRAQTLVWTALPNGFRTDKTTGKQYLKLSVFLSPRLESSSSTGTLGEFPDFFSGDGAATTWADTVNSLSFTVETWTQTTAGVSRRTVSARRTSDPADGELWQRFFPPTMPVARYRFRNLSLATFKTFPMKSVHALVKSQYATLASIPSRTYIRPTIAQVVQLPGLVTLPLLTVLPKPLVLSKGVSAFARAARVTETSATAAASAPNPAFEAFREFHRPWEVPPDWERLRPSVPEIDFHKAVSALGNYPALMRRLGFVVDLEIPFSTQIANAKRMRVMPTWADGRPHRGWSTSYAGDTIAHTDAMPWTACTITLTKTIPSKVVKFFATSRDGKVRDGYLVARSISDPAADPVRLYDLDVDIAASRMMSTAVSVASLLNRSVEIAVSKARASGDARPAAQIAAEAVAAVAATEKVTLPPLGQPVIRMAVPGLADRVRTLATAAAAANAKLVAGEDEAIVHYAEDITRGYRVDVWDSVTRHWHRLCGRIGRYSIDGEPIAWGAAETLQDEGWVQLGATSAPADVLTDDPPTEMRIHESVFDWNGWSLAVPRPGNSLPEPDENGVCTPTKTFTDPDGNTTELGHYRHPVLPLDVHWSVPPGDLPRLRFGTTYRFRARAVDLAGNSVAFSKGSTTADPGGTGDTNPYVTRAIVHQRFDPVKPPTVVPVAAPKPCESPHILVVRTYHPSGGSPVTQNTARHITPPRISVSMAEACGGLDASSTGRPMDKALWSELCARDAWDAPQTAPPGKTRPEAAPMTVFPSPVPYLPDPYARAAAFRGLPGVAAVTTSRTLGSGVVVSGVRIPLSSTASKTVASFRVSFVKSGAPWYERLPFKLSLRGIAATDGRLAVRGVPAAPSWDATKRVLRVDVPQADEYTVLLSSAVNEAVLARLGLHQWSMEKFVPALQTIRTPSISSKMSTAPALDPVPTTTSSTLPTAANALIAASKIGQNWMLTPPATLKLVHAVDRPLIAPAFTSRAHTERRSGDTHAVLVDWMPVHGKSTVKVDVTAEWTENIDDPSQGAPKWGASAVARNASVFTLTLPRDATTVLNAGQPLPGGMKTVSWGVIPAEGMLVSRQGVDTKPQRHHFGDTKHRRVTYRATFTSRYQEYFADLPDLTFTSTSAPKTLHVPSSARPVPPVVDYIVPTFRWSRSPGSSVRYGGGLRVYLERPWFSSGDDELLGVVFYQPSSSSSAWQGLQPYVTRWGTDPIWRAPGSLPSSLPTPKRFRGASRVKGGLVLREYPGSPVMVAGYSVSYDETTERWFADVSLDQGSAYFPFVKLALVRFQPYSLEGLELSGVVVADFVQIAPDRWASASVGADGTTVVCSMTGQSYTAGSAGRIAVVTMQLQKCPVGADLDVGWVDITEERGMKRQPLTLAQIASGDTRRTWHGSIQLPDKTGDMLYRAVIREYEVYATYNESEPGAPGEARRLIFAEAIPLSV